MPDSRRGAARLAVRIDAAIWTQEVERFAAQSPARLAAERERGRLTKQGLWKSQLLRCDPEGADGTRLLGLVKAYVPISERPPSERPFGFVFAPTVSDGGLVLDLVAFGERHPRRGARGVYERAHKRIHGRYQDQ